MSDSGAAPLPRPAPTPNPYGIPDQIVQNRAASEADRISADTYAAIRNFYNVAIGDDLAIAGAGSNTGKLVLQGGVKLSSDELKVGAELAGRGHEVVARSASGVGKSADFLIDGKPTELKTISNAKTDSAATALTRTIKEATKQGKNVIIDARNQRGLTESKARASMQNAVDELPRSRIDEVRLLGLDGSKAFEIMVKK